MQASEREGFPNVPSGTVTFLFTDIEGSTKLLEQLREGYATVLADQRDLLRAAFAAHNGHEIDTQGDAFFVAFSRALDAIECVIEAQQALAQHTWPENVAVRVRMGLHTGEPILGRTGYVGMDVHRAARIAAAGHGGQVLLSQTTRDLIYQDLPPGTALRALGEHKLKDIRFAQPLYQLDIAGLPNEFAPLKTLSSGEEPPAPGEPPFKGLQYFDEADADWFFGRDGVIGRLVARACTERFLAVIGASGSGKSSLVRAGLVPALKRGGPATPCPDVAWQIFVLTPTAHPLEALATSLGRPAGSMAATAGLIDDLRADPRSLNLYAQRQLRLDQRGARAARQERMLLVVDQFEELFTLCRDAAERQAFVDNLLTATSADGGGVSVLLTLRADFYEHLAAYPGLSAAVAQHQEYLGAMNAAELRQAIEAPAARGGWEFSPGLVDLLLHEIGASHDRPPEPGALPLLSHALLETWKHRRGNVMNLRAYSESGGVRGAIAHTAEGVFQQELNPAQQAIARNIFLRLTELGEGTQDTRRRVTYGELFPEAQGADVEEVLSRLADARLITTSEGTVEVAHEALIREWPTLRQWLDDDREGLRLHRHLTESAQSWAAFNRDTSELYRGTRLGQAAEWAAAHPVQLNALEQEFLDASQAQTKHDETEREAARQRELQAAQHLAEAQQQRADAQTRAARQLRRRAVYLWGALVVALAAALAAIVFGQRASQAATTAQTNARIAFSRELAAAAISNLNVDPERSLLLALQAMTVTYSVNQTWLPEAEEALHRSLEASRVEITLRQPQSVKAVAFNPTGTQLATANDAGTATLWDLGTQTALFTLPMQAPPGADALAFSYDGQRLATSSTPGSVDLWETATGQLLQTLHGNIGPINQVAFSPDGTRLAGLSVEGAAILWETNNGQGHVLSFGTAGNVLSLSFSPDGSRLALLHGNGTDGDISILDTAIGKLLFHFSGPGAGQIAFNVDGTRLRTLYGTEENEWDTLTGQKLVTTTLQATTDQILPITFGHILALGVKDLPQLETLAYSPDGTRLATGNAAGTALIWDSTTGQLLMSLSGHLGAVNALAFSPDGARLATASNDGTTRVWNVGLSRELFTVAVPPGLGGHIALDHNGTRMAMGVGTDGLAKVWDTATGQERITLATHNAVLALALSPEGNQLAMASQDWVPAVRDVATGYTLFSLQGSFGQITDYAYSPDGARLVSVTDWGTVKVWDATNGHQLTATANNAEVPLLAVAFSPDGTRLATAGADGTVHIRDAATLMVLLTMTSTNSVRAVTFSPDGTRLATGTVDGSEIWDLGKGQQLHSLATHTGLITAVAFSPNGKLLATAGRDGIARIWDVDSGMELLSLPGGGRGLNGVTFSDHGARLITSGDDGIRVYVLPIGDLAALARRRVTRDFTLAECQQYLHVAQCPGQVPLTPSP